MKRLFAAVLLTVTLAGAGVAPANANAAPPRALQTVDRGEWLLRERGSQAAGDRLCAMDPAVLLQPRHSAESCERFVIDNLADRATVNYQCPRSGHGRTEIRVETSRLLHIHSQGVKDGEPFESYVEARYIGACKAAARK